MASGVRYDLILKDTSGQYLKDLCRYHVGGQLKIAPEHVADKVLRLMNKPAQSEYKKFIRQFKQVNQELGKEQYLIPYFISAHPGCDLQDTVELAEFVRDQLQYHPEQVQNFTPTPMTISTCMYHTGIDPFTQRQLYVPRGSRERKWQRALLQYRDPRNKNLVREALENCGREDLIAASPKALLWKSQPRNSAQEARVNAAKTKKSKPGKKIRKKHKGDKR